MDRLLGFLPVPVARDRAGWDRVRRRWYASTIFDGVYAFRPDGTKKWTFSTSDTVTSSLAIGADGTVFFGASDRNVYALNPDGTKMWSFATGGGVTSSLAIGADGTVYIGASYTDHNLYAFGP